MKNTAKTMIALVFLMAVFAVTGFQARNVAAQETAPLNASTPISYFIVRGKVFVNKLGIVIPVGNAKVNIENTKTNHKTTVKTNALGIYKAKVGNGEYKVSVENKNRLTFRPFLRIVSVDGKNALGINFRGFKN